MQWQQQAACKDLDVNLFTVVDEDHPDGLGKTPQEHRVQTYDNFIKAKVYCDSCPVATLCRESASERDLIDTLRGGIISQRFMSARKDPVEGRFDLSRPCANGHVDRDKWGKCKPCHLAGKRRRRAEARLRGEIGSAG